MLAMVTTMTATDSGWSFPRAGAAASEAGWAGGAGAEVSQLLSDVEVDHVCVSCIVYWLGPPARRSQYRVMVTGLPPTGSWQDLKDHMREAGDVCYSDVFKDGSGVVEYMRREDMKYALKKLDDTKFKSHEVCLP